jgi:hypothetical protein
LKNGNYEALRIQKITSTDCPKPKPCWGLTACSGRRCRLLRTGLANAGLAFGGFRQALQQLGTELDAGTPASRLHLSLRRSFHAAAVVLPAQGATARVERGRNAHGLIEDIKTPSLGLGGDALVMAKTSRG